MLENLMVLSCNRDATTQLLFFYTYVVPIFYERLLLSWAVWSCVFLENGSLTEAFDDVSTTAALLDQGAGKKSMLVFIKRDVHIV